MMAKMSMLRIFTCLAATTMFMEVAMAVNYTVGGTTGGGGWDAVTNLQAWAASQTFLVGDNLIFQYTANHNVLEVSKTEYDSCQPTNPIQTYADTNSIVPLTTLGSQYFICGSPGHCSIGMKVQIDTLAAVTATAPPPTLSDDVVDPAMPSLSPTFFPLSPSNAPANSPTSGVSRTPFDRSNTFPETTSSAASKEGVMIGSIVGFGFFMVTLSCSLSISNDKSSN